VKGEGLRSNPLIPTARDITYGMKSKSVGDVAKETKAHDTL